MIPPSPEPDDHTGAMATDTGSPAAWGERPGDSVGPYWLIERLGEGGFGVVWLAERRAPMVQRVALKIIKPGMDSRAVLARFEHERQALAVMDHPSVAKVFDGGVTPAGRPYFVMEHVAGPPITDYCDARRLTVRERLVLFAQVCDAVQHAHSKGIIHRDLKPGNILVGSPDDRATPKVIDFGIAKAVHGGSVGETVVTARGQVIGTPEYMSPEQAGWGGADVDTRTDVYSLGAVLYELLAGTTARDSAALRGRPIDAALRALYDEAPVRPSTRISREPAAADIAAARRSTPAQLERELRRELEWIPLKAMQQERSRRYRTPADLADDVRAYLEGRALRAGPDSGAYLARKFVARHRVGLAAGAACGALLLAGIVGTSLGMERARRGERDALAQQRRADAVLDVIKQMLAGVQPSVAAGRDTALLQDLLDATTSRVERGEFSSQPGVELELCSVLGESSLDIGDTERAAAMAVRALGLADRLHPGDSVQRAHMLGLLASVRSAQGRHAEAEAQFADAAAILERVHPGDHAETARALSSLGTVRSLLGRDEECAEIQRRVLAMRERLFAGDHPDLAFSLHNVALALEARGQYAEAEGLMRRSLDMRRRLYTGDHPETARSLHGLAFIKEPMGQYEEAMALYHEALAMRRRLFRNDHADLVATVSGIAYLSRTMGRLDDAADRFREVLEMRRRALRPDHPDLQPALGNLGVTLDELGRAAEAEAVWSELLALRERTLRAADWRLGNTRSRLGACIAAQGRYAEAEPMLIGAYESLKAGADTPRAKGEDFLRDAGERVVRLYQAWDAAERGAGGTGKSTELDRWRAEVARLPDPP